MSEDTATVVSFLVQIGLAILLGLIIKSCLGEKEPGEEEWKIPKPRVNFSCSWDRR